MTPIAQDAPPFPNELHSLWVVASSCQIVHQFQLPRVAR
jgi:hypothetical protein